MQYARNTDVTPDRTRQEIERNLIRYGAKGFVYGWQEDRAIVEFIMENKKIRFIITLPTENEFSRTPERRALRKPAARKEAWIQACNQRWRALSLMIKAKLEAVECKITTFEEEFMPHVVLPNDQTMAQVILPQMQRALNGGPLPRLLTEGSA